MYVICVWFDYFERKYVRKTDLRIVDGVGLLNIKNDHRYYSMCQGWCNYVKENVKSFVVFSHGACSQIGSYKGRRNQ